MKCLLVPVKFDVCGANAAHYAADMALALDADLHLLYVLEYPEGPPETPLLYIREGLKKNARLLLRELADDLGRRTGGQVTISTALEGGNVENRIAEYARRIQPFLVIMGAPGEPVNKMIPDSDTLAAVRHLPFPVLVVPGKEKFRAIHTIALACEVHDILDGIPASLTFFRELKEMFAAKYEIIHFITGRSGGDKAIFEVYHGKQRLQELIPELHFIEAASVEDGVLQYLASHRVDWLMIFPKKHGLLEFHKSHSKRIVMHSSVPVLSIGEHATMEAHKQKAID